MPQRHWPSAAHTFERVALHITHAEPAKPHAPSDGVLQVPAEQHPFGQLLALQAPPEHTPPMHVLAQGGYVPQRHTPSLEQLSALLALQERHIDPAAPHDAKDGVLHVPMQQPLGQLEGVQATLVHMPEALHC